MKKHNLENTIHATNYFKSKDEVLSKIKETIDDGLPVTLYTLNSGSGDLGNHYAMSMSMKIK